MTMVECIEQRKTTLSGVVEGALQATIHGGDADAERLGHLRRGRPGCAGVHRRHPAAPAARGRGPQRDQAQERSIETSGHRRRHAWPRWHRRAGSRSRSWRATARPCDARRSWSWPSWPASAASRRRTSPPSARRSSWSRSGSTRRWRRQQDRVNAEAPGSPAPDRDGARSSRRGAGDADASRTR